MELMEAGAMEDVQPGYKRTEVGVFPEDWNVLVLGDQCQVITKGTTPTSIGKSFRSFGISFIKAESLTDEGVVKPELVAFIDEDTHRLLRRSQLQEHDILFSIAGVLGRVAVVPAHILPANTNQALGIIRLSAETKLDAGYLVRVLRSAAITAHIHGINVQATQANLSLKNIAEFPIPCPPTLTEQRRIASALSDADGLVAGLEAVLAKKRAIKQGALQALLTPPGQPGHRRLPGFSGGWGVKRLGEVAELIRSSVVPAQHPEAMFSHYSLPAFDAGRQPTREPGAAIATNKFQVFSGCILLSKLNPRIPRVWMPDHVTNNSVASTEFLVLMPRTNVIREFLYTACSTTAFGALMELAVTGTTGSHQRVNPRDALALELWLPSDLQEQTAIATVLTDMDAELRALEGQLAKLRGVKQGLIGVLLTGRKRLV